MTTPAFLHPFARPTRPADQYVTMVGGAGAEVWDRDGRRYIDGMASLWYCNAGYGRVEIADAARAQMVALAAFSCFEPFTNEPADELAELIATLAPVPESRVFFTSSGSEAVDSAIKLARIAHVRAGHAERTVIVSRDRAYHGVTYGGLSAQGLPLNKEGFGPLVEGVVNLPADDIEAMAGYLAEHGVVVAPSVRAPLEADETWLLRHGHTYSGHPTACAAALANLRILKEEGLVERAAAVGQRLFAGFGAIAADGRLAEVRSEVAVGALKLTPDHDAFAVRDALMADGVLTRAVNTETLTWCPPLVITDAQIDRVVDAVAAALG
jgi:adenosylmethionine-8-amino-7-oxononanoate aminotransferase